MGVLCAMAIRTFVEHNCYVERVVWKDKNIFVRGSIDAAAKVWVFRSSNAFKNHGQFRWTS